MADDDSQLIFWAAPDGASSVEITWIVPAIKKRRADRRVPRTEATHARVRRWGGREPGDQIVTAEDADRLVRELEVFQAQQAVLGIEQTRRRQARLASLSSRCPHCDVTRTYAGVQRQLEGPSHLGVHVYQCSYCGSIELFRDGGSIDHPLPGSAEPGPGPT